MAVLERFPHLIYRCQNVGGYTDENGDYVKGTTTFYEAQECSIVRAHGAEREIVFDDGIATKYSYTVYLPANAKPFKTGDMVKVKFKNGTEKEFRVLGFTPLQLQSKLYI